MARNFPEENLEQRDRFQALTLPHLGRLRSLAARWGTLSDAEDSVQETYLRAYRAFDQLRDPEVVFAWLCRILRAVVSERHRTHARRGDLMQITQLEEAHERVAASAEPSPLEQLLSRVRVCELRKALRSIPEEFAQAIELHEMHGLKYREIAEATSTPIGTVMSRISRGRQLLAGLLVAAR
jgi:RNA polymerase sigma-70 factor, ECF subfamily